LSDQAAPSTAETPIVNLTAPVATPTRPGGGAGAGIVAPNTGAGVAGSGPGFPMLPVLLVLGAAGLAGLGAATYRRRRS